MTKLNQTGRREAKKLIESHFEGMLKMCEPCEEIAEKICLDQAKKFKKELSKIKKLTDQRDSLLSELQEAVPDGLKVTPEGKLTIIHRRTWALVEAKNAEVEKFNKPILKKEKKAMAYLQTIQTLEELKALFDSVGI